MSMNPAREDAPGRFRSISICCVLLRLIVALLSRAFSTVAGQYSWHGWEIEGGFVTVEILAGANPGTTMVYDNMQASYLPAPGALALLMLGAGAMRRRVRAVRRPKRAETCTSCPGWASAPRTRCAPSFDRRTAGSEMVQ